MYIQVNAPAQKSLKEQKASLIKHAKEKRIKDYSIRLDNNRYYLVGKI